MQKNMSIEEYIEILASKEAIPGGGSAAALVAAIGNALCGMVFSLTTNKKSFELNEDSVKEMVKEAAKFSKEANQLLLKSMDEDGKAFQQLLECYKMPKETTKDKESRNEKLQKCYFDSLSVPLQLAEKSLELYSSIEISCLHGNKNLISDAGVAAILINAAIESAILNVKINLSGINNTELKDKLNNRIKEIEIENNLKKVKIMTLVEKEI
ncbi:cyclodeaminase/cyclohydrolase family protein [Clostridium grantii]|uniref:Formiminotetrahydrofolate cyclodeaminase n=1 Tax=Clostridium grantii DSM 8605 TaxID=1121316 RepID=A0A1M5SLI6_9CLOT|nr:cyclodeaminase/cyclohydrolase family protein [Clostridium grantii]SHH39379.1 Formiminotetrahydrofolate cyclodeaminase [Clostridium grantii DSM 8605]